MEGAGATSWSCNALLHSTIAGAKAGHFHRMSGSCVATFFRPRTLFKTRKKQSTQNTNVEKFEILVITRTETVHCLASSHVIRTLVAYCEMPCEYMQFVQRLGGETPQRIHYDNNWAPQASLADGPAARKAVDSVRSSMWLIY